MKAAFVAMVVNTDDNECGGGVYGVFLVIEAHGGTCICVVLHVLPLRLFFGRTFKPACYILPNSTSTVINFNSTELD